MPTVEVDPDELRRFTGRAEKDDETLKSDLFALGLEFEGETDDGEFELEFAPDRLDRLSVEGVARSLRYQYGDDRGVYVPTTNDAEWTIEVADVPEQRPYVTGAVVRGLDLDETALESLIQLQEKLHATMGRQRAKGAIGVHDLTMLKGEILREDADRAKSVTYTGIEPDGDTFVPLESDAELTPEETLEQHHIGAEYADLVAEYGRMPAIYDEVGLFSFPPVVNGRRTEVTTDSRDLFIEMTGTDQWTIDKMLTIVCYALDARGGRVEEVQVDYSDATATPEHGADLRRPDLATKTKTVAHEDIETTLGIALDGETVVDLFERAGLDARADEDGPLTYAVEVPPYRTDVLHPVDLVDDVGRAYGFNDLDPRYPDVSTVGGRHERSRLERTARETLVGLGFEDLLNFHLIDEDQNYERLGLSADAGDRADAVGGGEAVTIEQPYSEDFTLVRTWALPSVLMVLENNTHRAYPQDLAEVGFSAAVDRTTNTNVAERRTVAGALCRSGASYEDAKAKLQALAAAFDVSLATPPTDHPTFIDGRTASVVLDGETVGVLGEVHPEVLVEHDLELPVAAFEFELDALR